MKTPTLASLLLLLTLSAKTASADTLAFNEAGTSIDTGATGIVGFNFTVSASISVTQLGFFGQSMGADTPWVALYDVTSTPVQLAAITTFSSTNGWQYISLGAPITLTTGKTYQVAATAYWSPRYTNTSSFTFGSVITPVTFTNPTGWSGWGTPTAGTGTSTAANITGNFAYTLAAIPEPSTYGTILGLSTIGIALCVRRRKQR